MREVGGLNSGRLAKSVRPQYLQSVSSSSLLVGQILYTSSQWYSTGRYSQKRLWCHPPSFSNELPILVATCNRFRSVWRGPVKLNPSGNPVFPMKPITFTTGTWRIDHIRQNDELLGQLRWNQLSKDWGGHTPSPVLNPSRASSGAVGVMMISYFDAKSSKTGRTRAHPSYASSISFRVNFVSSM